MNINGLCTKRTNKLNSEYVIDVFRNNDIVLFTETWTCPLSDLQVDGFEHYVLHRTTIKSSAKRNSGGIIIYVKNTLVSDDTLIYTSQDDIIWIKISSDKLDIKRNIYIGLCYVLPDDSSRQSVVENNIFDRLIDSVVHVENISEDDGFISIFGDFNSRTSVLPDFVEQDVGNANTDDILPVDYVSDIECARFSQDQGHVNNNGRLLLYFCKETGFRITNG